MFLNHSVATQGPQISQANSKKKMQIQIWGLGEVGEVEPEIAIL